jgi:hypothetical protein
MVGTAHRRAVPPFNRHRSDESLRISWHHYTQHMILGLQPDLPPQGSQKAGDIDLSLEEAETLVSGIESEFVSAQASKILEARRRCSCGKRIAYETTTRRHDPRTLNR